MTPLATPVPVTVWPGTIKEFSAESVTDAELLTVVSTIAVMVGVTDDEQLRLSEMLVSEQKPLIVGWAGTFSGVSD